MFPSIVSGSGAGLGTRDLLSARNFFSTPVVGATCVTRAAIIALHLGTISHLGTAAVFGVNTSSGTGNDRGIFGTANIVSTVSTSCQFVLGYE